MTACSRPHVRFRLDRSSYVGDANVAAEAIDDQGRQAEVELCHIESPERWFAFVDLLDGARSFDLG